MAKSAPEFFEAVYQRAGTAPVHIADSVFGRIDPDRSRHYDLTTQIANLMQAAYEVHSAADGPVCDAATTAKRHAV